MWIAAERFPELAAIHPARRPAPRASTCRRAASSQPWTRDRAIVELIRSRLSLVGPTTARALAASLAIDQADATAALIALETEGVVLRGAFSGVERSSNGATVACWRASIATRSIGSAPKSNRSAAADFQRFLFVWHAVDPAHHLSGIDGLRTVLSILDGVELPARRVGTRGAAGAARSLRPGLARHAVPDGRGGLGTADRQRTPAGDRTPSLRVALFLREHGDAWQTLRFADQRRGRRAGSSAHRPTRVRCWTRCAREGASFLNEIVRACAIDEAACSAAHRRAGGRGPCRLGRIRRRSRGHAHVRHRPPPPDRTSGSRRALVAACALELSAADREPAIETQARALLARYGVVFRRLLARETNAAPWRGLTAVYRRLEARGEIRGGRFVSGMSGEQFALPEAVERVREIRESRRDGRLITISAVDPLNLTGILTSGERIRSMTSNRLVYRDGVALAAMEGDYRAAAHRHRCNAGRNVASALAARPLPAVTSGFVGR